MRVKGIFIFTTTAVYENTVNLCNGSSQNVPVLVKSVISEINSSIAVPKVFRGHPGSNQGPLDLQSNALPLSYIPCWFCGQLFKRNCFEFGKKDGAVVLNESGYLW